MSPTRRRITAWIASFAILLAALAPTLAQALAAPGDGAAPWSEICTAAGLPSGETGPPGGDGQASHGLKHCPWCAGHNHAFALPTAHYALPEDGGADTPNAASLAAPPRQSKLHGSSQPRAPPSHS